MNEKLENAVSDIDTDKDFDPFANSEPVKKSSGKGVAWLALLISLGIAGFTGWQWWQQQNASQDEQQVLRTVDGLSSEQAALQRQFDNAASRLEQVETRDYTAQLDELKGRLERVTGESTADLQRLAANEKTLEEIRLRVGELESGLAALVVRGESTGKSMELSEVEYLLRTANERLQLFGDTRAADRALRLADEQLASLDDPVYIPVRQAIAAARSQLGDVVSVDHIALTQSLADLQSGIRGLPFPDEEVEPEADQTPEAGTEAPGIWERFKAAMSGLVTVRRNAPESDLISIEDKEYVRQGLWLQLESARLALMRTDTQTFQSALGRAEATINQYFDPDSRSVRLALEKIAAVSAAELETELPDISGPWKQLSRLRATEPAEAASAATTDTAIAAEAAEEAPEQVTGAEPEPVPEESTEPEGEPQG